MFVDDYNGVLLPAEMNSSNFANVSICSSVRQSLDRTSKIAGPIQNFEVPKSPGDILTLND